MALFGSIATLRAQAPQTTGFDTAFAYIEDLMRPESAARKRLQAVPPGNANKVELAGGVFAVEQVYQTKPRAEGIFESHQSYIDLQLIVEGEELMEVIDASRITVREPYEPARDLITYQDTPGASKLHVPAGDAAIFFPVDVHMPSLRPHSSGVLVRKSVVKIPVG
ncbi:MAG: YhcH/YjgK/YiaL family protein [Opitutaceae bacterium]